MECVRRPLDGLGAQARQAARVQPAAARRARHELHRRRSARSSSCRRSAMSSRSIRIPICRWMPRRKLVGTLAHPLNRRALRPDDRPRDGRLRRSPAARRHRRGQRVRDDVFGSLLGACRPRPVHDGGVGRVSGPVRRGQLRRQGHLRRRRVRARAGGPRTGQRASEPRPVRGAVRAGRRSAPTSKSSTTIPATT